MILGIEIGGSKLQLATGNANGRLAASKRFAVDTAKGATGIRSQIERAIPELIGTAKPEVVGVGFGGPVDWKTGQIRRSHHIAGWSDFNLAEWLRAVTGAPVFVDNDANVAALGEAVSGAGKEFNPVLYVTLGSGVGGGLVVDGKIYHGATPGESEIGHIRLDRDGNTVESRCSGWAVDARIRAAAKTNPSGAFSRMIGGATGGEARHLAAALAANDADAQRILKETAADLAFGLSHAIHLFHPEVIVLGGGLSRVGEPLRAAVASELPGLIMDAFAPGPRVLLSALGEDAVPLGAIHLGSRGGTEMPNKETRKP